MRVASTYRAMQGGNLSQDMYKAELASTPPQVQHYFEEAK